VLKSEIENSERKARRSTRPRPTRARSTNFFALHYQQRQYAAISPKTMRCIISHFLRRARWRRRTPSAAPNSSSTHAHRQHTPPRIVPQPAPRACARTVALPGLSTTPAYESFTASSSFPCAACVPTLLSQKVKRLTKSHFAKRSKHWRVAQHVQVHGNATTR
jgi:hypothetical protein